MNANCTVLILGCDHMFQTEQLDIETAVASWDSSVVQRKQKGLFVDKVRTILNTHPDISLIAEETIENASTFALAESKERGLGYANINLFKRQQKELGFPDAYLTLPEREQLPFHRIREQHFFDRTEANLPASGDIFFICGKLHADRMKSIFEANGYRTFMITLSAAEAFNYEWFIEPFEGFS